MSLPLAAVDYVEATWVLILKSLIIFALVFAIVPVLTVVERKVLGRFQARYGPNRVGPFGLMQPLADALKLIGKEGVHAPERAAAAVRARPAAGRLLGCHGAGDPALGRCAGGRLGCGVGLYGIDVSIGVLFFFAFGSFAFYGLLLLRLGLGVEY